MGLGNYGVGFEDDGLLAKLGLLRHACMCTIKHLVLSARFIAACWQCLIITNSEKQKRCIKTIQSKELGSGAAKQAHKKRESGFLK